VKLENVGPVRITYRKDEVRVEQANLRGTDTDVRVSGFARFAGDRAFKLSLMARATSIARSFVPRLETVVGRKKCSGCWDMSTPRFNGKVHVEGASIRYGDFPE